MRLTGAASTALRPVLAGPAQRAEWLGVSPRALYLATARPPAVLCILAHDATRLPCGLLLPSTSAELPLTALAPSLPGRTRAACTAGEGRIAWTGPGGPVTVTAAREWAPAAAARGTAAASAVDEVMTLLMAMPGDLDGHVGLDAHLLARLAGASDGEAATAVPALLGQGPGLTPSGDDVLAGFLVGAHAFGLRVPAVCRAVTGLAPARTTALSAQLLRHALRGECVAELATLATVMAGRGAPGPATRRVLAVGHTSGAALTRGMLLAGERALRPGGPERPAPGREAAAGAVPARAGIAA